MEGMDKVRVWIGRKGCRSLTGDKGALFVGASEVGVVDAFGETGAEEKWSEGEAGTSS